MWRKRVRQGWQLKGSQSARLCSLGFRVRTRDGKNAKTLKILSIQGNVTNLAQLKQTERTKYVKIEAIKSGKLRTLGPGKYKARDFEPEGSVYAAVCARRAGSGMG
jgi:hypothetical protein